MHLVLGKSPVVELKHFQHMLLHASVDGCPEPAIAMSFGICPPEKVGGQLRKRMWFSGQRFFFSKPQSGIIEQPNITQALKQPVPFCNKLLLVLSRVYKTGSIGKHCQSCGFSPGKLVRIP